VKLMQLLEQTSLPKGVVNMVQGDKTVVDGILTNPHVKAISFMGSTDVGKYIYQKGCENGKRVQSNAGAKNHCLVMPDYPLEQAVNMIIGASLGASGQRCMALSVVVVVGDADPFINLFLQEVRNLKISAGKNNPDMGPLIEPGQVQKLKNWVDESELAGAKVI
jgi:malonate-semialdehyde dehydrogenase (acetylating)/methylmalonate-semialdehyde dehydrogenase